MERKIVAVIVTFNRLEALKLTLEKTFTQAFHKVIVVNNCSTDGTENWLNFARENGQNRDRLIVIHSEKNQGGAGGFHLGFRYAAESLLEAQWLVAYDDDAYPEAGLLDTFNEAEVPQNTGGVAAAVYLPNGELSEMNRPSVNPFWHLKQLFSTLFKGREGFHINEETYRAETPTEIDASSFVGFFLRLSLVREGKIGLPRSELFIYADDIIYALQMRKAGYKHLFLPTLKFTHDCQTLIEKPGVYHPLWKVYYTFRNSLEMYRISTGIFYPLVFLVKIPSWFAAVRHYQANERKQFLTITATAVWDGIRRNYSKTHSEVVALAKS